MNPEEAADRLVAFLDAQAEAFRGPSEVSFTVSYQTVRTRTRNRQGIQRRYFRIMAVGPDMKIEGLDYWIRIATSIEVRHPEEQGDGHYCPETGFRFDDTNQPTEADVYDLLLHACQVARNGPADVVGFVKNIVIREVL